MELATLSRQYGEFYAPAFALRDTGFRTAPGRTVGGVSLQWAVDDQGGRNGDIRANTALNGANPGGSP